MKHSSIIIGGFIIILAIVLFAITRSSKQLEGTVQPTPPPVSDMQTETTPITTKDGETTEKQFTVVGGNFSFTPNKITVNKGDTVTIIFQNNEGFHDFVLDEFTIRTKQIKAGDQQTVQFIADKTGSFEYYCSVGTHRQMGMKGILEVK